jgi:hypothetical protein
MLPQEEADITQMENAGMSSKDVSLTVRSHCRFDLFVQCSSQYQPEHFNMERKTHFRNHELSFIFMVAQ